MPGDRPHSAWRRRWRLALARFDAGLTISIKLAVPFLVPGIVVVTVATGIVYRMEATRIRSDFEERVMLLTRGVAVSMRDHGSTELDTQLVAEVQDHLDGLAQSESSLLLINAYVVEGGQPRIIASSDPGRIVSPADAAQDVAAFYSLSAVVHEEKLAGERVLEVNLPVRLGGEPAVVLAAFFSTAERDSALAALLWTFGLAGAGGLVVALAALFLTFRVLVYRRLRRLMAPTERMHRGDYDARVEGVLPPEARDEMLRLSARFNEMAEAIQLLHGQLQEQASTDELTGTYNRRYVIQALQREAARAQRGHPLAVILLDVDMLKELNDRCGHAAGDDALRQLGAVLRRSVRESDVLARFGGDEFLILLPDCKGSRLRSALDRTQREMERLEVKCGGDGHVLPVTVSAGGALLREGDTAESLLQRADQALYEAKRAGRSRTRVAA